MEPSTIAEPHTSSLKVSESTNTSEINKVDTLSRVTFPRGLSFPKNASSRPGRHKISKQQKANDVVEDMKMFLRSIHEGHAEVTHIHKALHKNPSCVAALHNLAARNHASTQLIETLLFDSQWTSICTS